MTESLSHRNQSIDLLCKSMNWFLYDEELRHEREKMKRLLAFSKAINPPIEH